jgi:hypothetical protein
MFSQRDDEFISGISSLVNDAATNSEHEALNDWMTVNNELKRMWKKEIIVSFKALSWYLPGRTENKKFWEELIAYFP